MRRDLLLGGSIALLLGLVLAQLGFFDLARLSKGTANLVIFSRETVPPDLGVLPLAGRALLETVQMAVAGTLLGFLLALPLGLLGARSLFPPVVIALARFVGAALRAVPSLLWAVLFVIVVGLGPLAGSLALALYTVGYLSKLFAELFEGVDPEIMEAVRGVGASRPQLARFVVWPESANGALSQLLFMLEYNIRASSILGFVGAGGIGFYMQVYMQTLEYQRLATLLLLILAVVLFMDIFSAWVRKHYLLAFK
ncbi:MAG TPA: phosphonate ABC transporter, permease protein PhnE [Dehalococcoidia bacterium]|nr:phosphonate ABC transporter, permease protein PhnE [Dehalococcoidia bacterium]HLE02931.1 phosphonate ABC transporter, permease protein PhnE [Dehalococcoidia bacterium]